MGLTYRAAPNWQLGASHLSRQEMADFKWNRLDGTYRMALDGPEQYAVGIAYLNEDAGLLVEFDVRRILFSDVLDEVTLQTPRGISPCPSGGRIIPSSPWASRAR